MPERRHFPRASATSVGDNLHQLTEFDGAEVLGLLPGGVPGTEDIVFGEVRLPAGAVVPTHTNDRPEAFFVTEGTVRVWRPGGSAELSAPGAAYVPTGEAHSLQAVGGPATFLVAYATGNGVGKVGSSLCGDEALEAATNPNTAPSSGLFDRWAVAEAMVDWVPVEPTKALRLKCRYLLDPPTGTADFVIGTALIEPFTHYTIHRHAPAEIYHVFDGEARIYVGDEAYDVQPGDTVYVPAWAPHGIDTGSGQLSMYWFYTLDACNGEWAWEPLEPVYSTPPRRPLETGPRRGFHV